MEQRIPMWTGENTLKSISSFISGYFQALLENDLIPKSYTPEPFHDWVAEQLGFYESTAGWTNMILAVTMGLEPKNITWENFDSEITKEQHQMSIEKFYELLEEFVNKSTKHNKV